ncbi:MAG: hypothetical protein AAB152_11815 [Candidatus Coatesbacteria bacterium]
MNALLAVAIGWSLLVVAQTLGSWTEAADPLRALIRAWAISPEWTMAGGLAQAGRVAATVGLTLAALLAALGAGEAVAGPVTPRRGRLPLVVSFALGLGTLSALAAGLGFAGLLAPGALRVLVVGAIALGLRAAHARRAEFAAVARSFAGEPVATAAALVAAAVLMALLASLPDTHEDPLVYHWAAPEAFLRAHRIYPAVQHFQWHWPLGVEMVFACGLATGGVAAVKAATLVFLLLGCAGASSIARRLDRGAAGWTAACLVALAPAIAYHAWLAKNDPGVTAFWAAAVVAMLAWPPRSARGALIGGILAGFCASTKYTSFLPLAALAVWFGLRRPGLRALGLAVGAAVVVAAPWPARDWLLTRDPFYPLGPEALHGLWWAPPYTRALHLYAQQVTAIPAGGHPGLWLSWRDAFADPGQAGLPLAALAPLGLVLCLPGAAGVGAAVALALFLVTLTEWDFRFLLPLAPLIAAGGEVALRRLRDLAPRYTSAGWAILAAVGSAHLLVRVIVQLPPDDWSFLTGRLAGPAFFAQRYTADEEIRRWCADRLPPSERILLTGSDKRFGFSQTVVSSHVVTMPLPWRWAKESRTPEELAKKWRQAGIGCIAHNLVSGRFRHQGWFTGPPWSPRMLGVYRAFAKRYFTEVHRSPRMDYANGFFYVLRVEARPHPEARTVPVLPWTEAVTVDVRIAGNTGASKAKCLDLTDRALRLLPDVDDAVETAAYACAQTGAFNKALELNRALAARGFDGEIGWYELAVSESFLGRRPAAFAAVRRWTGLVGGLDPRAHELAATVFVNLAGARVHAGDGAGACRLLAIALRVKPGFPQALAGLADLRCPPVR